MHKTIFYKDDDGNEPVRKYIENLLLRPSKDGKIKYNKIRDYIVLLEERGLTLGEPYVKHIQNTSLWELRPLRDRIFFAVWDDDRFILLHQFMKKTKKTPQKEIDIAKNRFDKAREEFKKYEE